MNKIHFFRCELKIGKRKKRVFSGWFRGREVVYGPVEQKTTEKGN
jgi:hypothetical protein